MSVPPEPAADGEGSEARSVDRPLDDTSNQEGPGGQGLDRLPDEAPDREGLEAAEVDRPREAAPEREQAERSGGASVEFSAEEMLAWAEPHLDAGPVPPPGQTLAAEDAAAADPAGFEHGLRLAEALIFASDRPVPLARIQQVLPEGLSAQAVMTALVARSADRPVQCVEVAGGFAFRTAPELAPALIRVVEVPRRLPRVAMETLAIIAYHQPVTRAEIEEIRGASLSQQTLEALLEMGLVAPRGRKEVPGRPSLWATTPRFLEQFGLKALTDLPRREELVNEPGPLLRAVAPAEAPAGAPSEAPVGASLANDTVGAA